MEKHDVVIIGAGPGGYPAAIRAAQLGASTAIVEKECLGGTCLNWGCIPTKTLIASSDLYWSIRHAASMGLAVDKVSADYAAMIARKNDVVGKLRNGIAQLLKANGITVYKGTAAFASRNRIAVSGDGEPAELEAGRSIIATGSVSVMPGAFPKSKAVVESRAFLDLTSLPESMIVLGGGVVGCEFACMAAQLGVQVTVVELLEDILMILDADIRAESRRQMEKQLGIRFLTGKPLEKIQCQGSKVGGLVNGQAVEAELLLVSVGRKPVTDGLKLEQAGLKPNARGYLETDEYCQTKAATIYAVGDVTGGPQLAHAATAQGLAAAENACGRRTSWTRKRVPACIFTMPEIGVVGLTEQEAKQQNKSVRTGKFMFAALGKALASGEATGFVKWIVDAETDQLLGAQAIGPHATELIAQATLAVQSELTAAELGTCIHAHPTLSEAWMEAAHAVHGACIHAPPRKSAKPAQAKG